MSDTNMTPTPSTLDSSSTASGVVSPVANQEEEVTRNTSSTANNNNRHHPIEDFIKHVSETQVVGKAYVYASSVQSPKLVQTVAEKLTPYISLAQPVLASVVHSIDSGLDSTYNIVDDCVTRSQQLKSTTIVRVGKMRVVMDSVIVLTNETMQTLITIISEPRAAIASLREKSSAAVGDIRKRSASLCDDIAQFNQNSLLVNTVMKSRVFVFLHQIPSPINVFTDMMNMSRERVSTMRDMVIIRGKDMQTAIQGMMETVLQSQIGKELLLVKYEAAHAAVMAYLTGFTSKLAGLRNIFVEQLFIGMNWSRSKISDDKQMMIMDQLRWMGEKMSEVIGTKRTESLISTFHKILNRDGPAPQEEIAAATN